MADIVWRAREEADGKCWKRLRVVSAFTVASPHARRAESARPPAFAIADASARDVQDGLGAPTVGLKSDGYDSDGYIPADASGFEPAAMSRKRWVCVPWRRARRSGRAEGDGRGTAARSIDSAPPHPHVDSSPRR